VSTHHTVWPFASSCIRQVQSEANRDISVFAFFSSPPAAAKIIRPLDVTSTSLCLFLVVEPPKNLESFLCPSPSPFLVLGLLGSGAVSTIRFPSFRMRSLFLVKTGDHSMSSWVGGGNSVMMRGCGLEDPFIETPPVGTALEVGIGCGALEKPFS